MCSAIVKTPGGILGSPEISKLPFWFQWASVAGQWSSQTAGTDCHEELPDAGSESVSGQFCYVEYGRVAASLGAVRVGSGSEIHEKT